MNIIAVVPTYDRPDMLLRNLRCLLAQTVLLDKIVVVDNASRSETRLAFEQAGFRENATIHYLRLEVNVGASGGFKAGMVTAMEHGADWIWGMDDDAFPEPEALAHLLRVNTTGKYECLWSNVDEDLDFDGDTKQVELLIFVGFLVSRKLVERVGFPDENFYMYHDDTDYSLRIAQHGFSIHKVRDSVIEHKGFNKRGNPLTTYSTPFVNFSVMNCEAYRIYYIYRNFYFVKHLIKDRLRYVGRSLMVEFPKYLLLRPVSGMALGLGIAHAVLNKRGRAELPRIFLKSYY